MYLRRGEGFGQNQESWFVPQALHQVMVRPGPISYFGNFHEHLESPAEQTCPYHYSVANFRPNSWGLTVDIQKDIQKIANDIVGKVEHKLQRLRIKKRGKKADVYLNLDIRPYMDKKTDTARAMWHKGQNGEPLYRRRGTEVLTDLYGRIDAGLKRLHDRFNFSSSINYNYSPQGAAHPVSSTNPGENRRVEVCVLNLAVQKQRKEQQRTTKAA